MRRKLLAIVAMLCMVLSMVGCSSEATSFAGKLKEVSAWEGQEETGDMTFDIKAGEETVSMKADYTSYSNTVDMQSEVTFNVKEVSASGVTIDTTKGDYKLSPIKLVVADNKIYVNTSIIKDICKLAEVDLSKSVDLTKEYVALDLGDYGKQLGLEKKDAKAADKFQASMDELNKLKIDVPVKQDKDTYTVELNADQMITMFFKAVNTTMEQNPEMLKAQYKAMGLKDEEINEMLATVKAVYSDETKAEAIKALAGSTAKLTCNFSKDEYTTKVELAVKLDAGEEKVAFNMTMNDKVKKVAKKAVVAPTSAKVYSMADVMKDITEEAAALETNVEAKPAATTAK